MPDGISGFNVRTLGTSRDTVMSAARQVGGAFLLCHDDGELVPMARAAGIKTIYRQSGDEGDALKQDPTAFVAERAAKGADYIHLTNEVTSSPALHAWTLKALEAATAQGVKAVCYSYGSNAPRAAWDEARPVLEYAVAHGHAIGVHIYLDGTHDDGAWSWLNIKHKIGGRWIVTEFGYIRSIFNGFLGWRGQLTQTKLSAFMNVQLPVFALENMPVCHFSYDRWPFDSMGLATGFGLWDAPDVLKTLARLNESLVVKDTVTMPVPVAVPKPSADKLGTPLVGLLVTPTFVNLRSAPSTSAAVLLQVKNGGSVKAYPVTPSVDASGYNWRWVEVGAAGGWMAKLLPTWEQQIVAPVVAPPTPVFLPPLVVVPVPYVSQYGDARGANGCLAATTAMLDNWVFKENGTAKVLTSSDVSIAMNRAVGKDATLAMVALVSKTVYGITLDIKGSVTPDILADELDAGRPVGILYSRGLIPGELTIYPFAGSHGGVLCGYGYASDGQYYFLLLEPLMKGSDPTPLNVLESDLEAALVNPNTDNQPNQAIFIDPSALTSPPDPEPETSLFSESQWREIDTRILARIHEAMAAL